MKGCRFRWAALALWLVGACLPATAQPALASHPGARAATLSDVVQLGLPDDPRLLAARANLAAAQARVEQTRSKWLPSLGLNAAKGRSGETELGGPIERRTDRADASLRWNLFNGGADRGEGAASQAELDAAGFELERARQEVAQRIAEAFIDAVRLQQATRIADERSRTLDSLARLAELQQAAGKLSEADAQQIEIFRIDAESSRAQAHVDLETARRQLREIVAHPAFLQVGPLEWRGLPDPAPETDTASPAERAAAARAQAARRRVTPVEALAAPRIDLELQKQLSDRTTPPNTTELHRSWQVSVRWDIPLGGESAARRTEAERRADAADAELDRVRREARIAASSLAPQLAQLEQALRLADRQLGLYDELLAKAAVQFDAGRKSLVQWGQVVDNRSAAGLRQLDLLARQRKLQVSAMAAAGQLLQALGIDRAVGDVVQPSTSPSTTDLAPSRAAGGP